MDSVTEPHTTPTPFRPPEDNIGYIDFALSVEQISEYVVQQVRLADSRAKSAMWAACNAGALIATAKKKLKHGEVEKWVVDHCDISIRTAQAYMRLATRIQELPREEAQRVALLPVREAIKCISAPTEHSKRETDSDENPATEKSTAIATDIEALILAACKKSSAYTMVTSPKDRETIRKKLNKALTLMIALERQIDQDIAECEVIEDAA